jgi:tetratricopeptide (TPR) repeat protein
MNRPPNQHRHALTPTQAFDMAVTLHRQGRLDEAGQVYRAILKLDPNHFGALHYLGSIASQQGRPQEAEQLIRQALAIKPESAEARNNLGIALAALGRLDEARAEYEQAVALDHAHVEARNNLGNTLHALGRSSEAIAHFEKALAVRPETADVYNNLGNALAAVQRQGDAVTSFRRALAIRADFAEAHNNLGFVLASLGHHDEAVTEYEQAIMLRPRYLEAHNNLANTLGALKRYAEAITHFTNALAVRPDAFETHNNLGNVFSALKQHTEAASHYRKAIELKPDFSDAHNNLGNALAQLGRHDEAVTCYAKTLAISPDMAEAHGSLGNELKTLGRLDEARHALEKAVGLAPYHIELHRSLAETKQYTVGDPQIAAMEALAVNMGSLSEDERIALHFALAKAYADCGEHARSFRHLLDGNALKRRQVRYDEADTFAKFQRLKAVFTPELIRKKHGLGHPSELPTFIVGMPRSGTTLVEQVLASHHKVFGGGELKHMVDVVARLERADIGGIPFPEVMPSMGEQDLREVAENYLAALDAADGGVQRITDKLPGNLLLAGLIHLAMPRARIIHVRRNPIDTCLSCFSKLFVGDVPFCYDLRELGRYYRAYEDLMEHWRRVLPEGVMLDVQYEELVADFEPQARRLLAYCGLDWDERCLAFHETQRPIRTASATQVRQPIYRTSVGRWRPYREMLQPLLQELGAG